MKLAAFVLAVGMMLAGCDDLAAEDHLNRALEFEQAGQYREAVIELKNALQKDPDYSEARYRLGLLYEWGGDFATSVKELDRALELGYEKEVVRVPLLRAKIYLGRSDEVLDELADEPALTPELRALQGFAYLRSGERGLAEQQFRLAMDEQENLLDAQMGMIELLAPSSPEEAMEFAEAATDAFPDRREAWYSLAKLQEQLGDRDAALASYQRVTELPGGRLIGTLGAAQVLLLDNRLEEAGEQVQAALRLQRNHPIAHYYAAYLAFIQDDLETALDELRAVEQVYPEYLPAQYLLGTVQFRRGQMNQAADALRTYLARAPRGLPQNGSARALLAAIYMESNDVDNAIEVLAEAPEELDPQGLAMLGTLYGRVGEHSMASTYLRRAVAQAPDAAEFRNRLAVSLMEEGDMTEARSVLEGALELDENLFASKELLVRMHLRNGDFDEAEAVAQGEVDAAPEEPLGHQLLGIVYLEKGELSAATDAFEAALAADARFVPALEGLAQIDRLEDRSDDAMDRYRQILEIAPGNEAAAVALADDARGRGDLRGAADILSQLRTDNPSTLLGRLSLAEVLLALNERTFALVVSEEAVELAPQNVSANLVRIQSLAANGKTREALAASRDLARSTSELPRAAVILRSVLEAAEGNTQVAIDILDEWTAEHPDDVDAVFRLATLQIPVDPEAAKTRFEGLRGKAPDSYTVAILNNLASAYTQLGDERAVPTARQALELAPESGSVMDTLGWALVKAGQTDEAVTVLRDALARTDGHPTVSYHLAVALEQAGDSAGAAASARQSLEAADGFPEVEAAKALLERLGG